ncbi:hypothetical protein KI387_028460 [Taxus chinensis]|uniref:Disease resistance protein Roq1-like winged-helix domain-containing protein n=1 Tax=Taxus chinensis TaxID=29808 RepID=A0AA38CH41_TAXCH|nr:hypothetical protein KI387_028460 [Taxus chinensis]
MGGAGKTKFSKELFNRKCSSFDCGSFVSEVRDAASKNALYEKKKKLLKDLGATDLSFDYVDEGNIILANHLSSLRVLIILDDMDHRDQLDALLPDINVLAPGSLVIVTSCELGVLKSWGISCKLSYATAESLTCPVLGAQLYGPKSKDYWESQLNKISRILPADIRQRLQVSYNALDEEEKEIFLDVSCFFIGEEKSLAIAVWDGSSWSGLHSWETLVNKCLVELDEKNHIRMHDHLRDMGREIASTHSPYQLRFLEQSTEHILNIIQKNSQERMLIREITNPECGSVPVKKHILKLIGNSRRKSKRLNSSLGLQILHMDGNEFTEELAPISEDLVWLCWQLKMLPVSFKQLASVKYLDVSQCKMFKFRLDMFENIMKLEYLNLNHCLELELLPGEITNQTFLRELYLQHTKLRDFPANIGQLGKLETLRIGSSQVLQILLP